MEAEKQSIATVARFAAKPVLSEWSQRFTLAIGLVRWIPWNRIKCKILEMRKQLGVRSWRCAFRVAYLFCRGQRQPGHLIQKHRMRQYAPSVQRQ